MSLDSEPPPEVDASPSELSPLLAEAYDFLQGYQSHEASGAVTQADLEREIRARLVGAGLLEACEPKPAAHYWKLIGVPAEPIGKDGARIHWCGVFVLAMLWRLKLCAWRWRTDRGFLSRLPVISNADALPGDLVYLRKRSRHHAMWIDPATGLSLDGNSGAAPGTVAVRRKDPSDPVVITYSINPLVRALARRVLAEYSEGLPDA